MRLKSKLSIAPAQPYFIFTAEMRSFIFRKRFSPKFLWSLGLHKGSSNWFQIIYGRVNHLMTSINNATFQLWRRIDSKNQEKKLKYYQNPSWDTFFIMKNAFWCSILMIKRPHMFGISLNNKSNFWVIPECLLHSN